MSPADLAILEQIYSGGDVQVGTTRTGGSAGIPALWGIVAVVILAALLLLWGTVETVVDAVVDAAEAGVKAAADVADAVADTPRRAARAATSAARRVG